MLPVVIVQDTISDNKEDSEIEERLVIFAETTSTLAMDSVTTEEIMLGPSKKVPAIVCEFPPIFFFTRSLDISLPEGFRLQRFCAMALPVG